MWGDLIITVKKPESLPTDALSGQATGSRDLEVPLKVCVLMCPLDLVCLKIPPTRGESPPPPHPVYGAPLVLSVSSGDLVCAFLWCALPVLLRVLQLAPRHRSRVTLNSWYK